jgi:hypothetical protein
MEYINNNTNIHAISMNTNIKLLSLQKKNFNLKFKIFYRFRFHKDYLINNIDKKKYNKFESKKWFLKNHKKQIILSINYKKKNIGLIVYNLNNFFYSIIILKKYRNKNFGELAFKKFVNFLKKKKYKLFTLIKKNNLISNNFHKKFLIYKKNYNKEFYIAKIL